MAGDPLLEPYLAPGDPALRTGSPAWLGALLEVEAALAAAQAEVGLVPPEAAAAIASACDPSRYDVAALAEAGRASGNPVVPLVRALVGEVPDAARPFVHLGATSQDVLDTAMMLVARRALHLMGDDLAAAADACAGLAGDHVGTPMLGRTLLQGAVPVTFGLKAAGWLVGIVEAGQRLEEVRERRLAVQLGGAAGTLSGLGDRGLDVMAGLARRLELAVPVMPWHATRGRVAELAGALTGAAGALAKVARDVALLAQPEVAEAAEAAVPGRGGSSAMPHKRNPVASMSVLACYARAQGLALTLLGALAPEHERGLGSWQAEWASLSDLLAVTGGAAAWARELLEGLIVHSGRMRANLERAGGAVQSEAVAAALLPHLGRTGAHEAVADALRRARDEGRELRQVLLEDAVVGRHLDAATLDAALDPARHLGLAGPFVERALGAHADWRASRP